VLPAAASFAAPGWAKTGIAATITIAAADNRKNPIFLIVFS